MWLFSNSDDKIIILYFDMCSPEKKKRKYWAHSIKAEREKKVEFSLVKESLFFEDKFYGYFNYNMNEF